jgi:hypothetical protein
MVCGAALATYMAFFLPVLVQGSSAFEVAVARLHARGADDLEAVAPAVRDILARVRREGDAGVLACVAAF